MHPFLQNLVIRSIVEKSKDLKGESQKQGSHIHLCSLLTASENIKCGNLASYEMAKLFACNEKSTEDLLKNKIAIKVKFREINMLCQGKKECYFLIKRYSFY